MTRWLGIANAIGFSAQAWAIAGSDFGPLTRRASCAYVKGFPNAIVRSASQTRRWNGVPRMSRSRSSGSRGTAMNCRTLVRSSRSRRLFETIRLSGKLAVRSCSSSTAVEPNRIAQTPIGLRATRTFPRAQSPTTNSISCAAPLVIDAVSRGASSATINFIGLTPVVYPADDTTNATALAHSDFRLHIEDATYVAQKLRCDRAK